MDESQQCSDEREGLKERFGIYIARLREYAYDTAALVGALEQLVVMLEEFSEGELPPFMADGEGVLAVLDALRGTREDDVRVEACNALYAFTERAGAAGARVLVDQGVLPVLIETVRDGPPRAKLYAMRVLNNLGGPGSGCHSEVAGAPGVLDALVAATRALQDGDEQIAMNGVGALCTITGPEGPHRAAAAAAGALGVSLDAMAAHSASSVVASVGCGVVENLTGVVPPGPQRERALALVVAALRAHADVAQVQSCGFAALSEIVSDEGTWQDVAALDVVPLLLQPLQDGACGNEAAVCSALRSLVALVQAAGEGRALARSARVLEAVSSALAAWPDSAYIQWGCAAAFAGLCEDAVGAEDRLDTLTGAVPLIVAALRAHSNDAAVCDAGSAALSCVVAWPAGVALEAMEALAAAMEAQATVAAVQARACAALYHVSESIAEGVPPPLTASVCAAVIAAMAGHPGVCDVHLYASRVIANMAVSDAAVRVVLAANGVPLIIEGIARYSDAPMNMWNAVGALYRLTSRLSAESGAAVRAAGGVAATLTAMAAYVDEETLQWAGCAVLANVLGGDAGGSGQAIAGAEGVGAAVRASIAHRDSASVQWRACALLGGIASYLVARQQSLDVLLLDGEEAALARGASALESPALRDSDTVRGASCEFLYTVASASAPAAQRLRSRAALLAALEDADADATPALASLRALLLAAPYK